MQNTFRDDGKPRVAPRARDASRPADEGFTLVEAVVGIGIAVAVFLAFAATLMSSLTGTLAARQNQGAIDVLSEQVERVRAETYTAVALAAADLSDPRITLVGGVHQFDPDGTGAMTEPVVSAATAPASLAPHTHVVVRSNVRYTVSLYVTQPAGATAGYKRLTVIVSWQRHSQTLTKSTTTYLTHTRRGLPLPKFTFGSAVSITVTPGGEAHLPAVLTNRGARHAWDLTITTPTDRTWSWTVYRDDNANAVKDSTENTVLASIGPNGSWQTSTIETDASLAFVAVSTLPSNERLGQVDVTLKATSVLDPTAAGGTAQVVDRVLVQATGCAASCGDRTLYLRNALTAGDTVRQPTMPMELQASTNTTLHNYDTDTDSAPGRLLGKGGSGPAETDNGKVVRWQRVATEDATFRGDVVIRFYAAIKDLKASTRGELVGYVRSQDATGAWLPARSGTFKLNNWGGDFREAELRVPVDFAVATGRRVEVTVVNTSWSGDDMWVAYDTTSYPAKAIFPAVAP